MFGRGPARAFASLAYVGAIAGCTQILGIDGEIGSVVTDFCKCEDLEERWPGETCQDHVTGRLSAADAPIVTAWLELYEQQRCGTCGSPGRASCAAAEPLCVNVGGSCANSSVCCGSVADAVYCGENRRCVQDAECLSPGSVCEPGGDPCCGAAGLNASCEADAGGTLRCLEVCDLTQPGNNCPGCCGRYAEITELGTEQAGLCSADEGDICARICNPEVGDGCTDGLVCLPNLFKTPEGAFSVGLCTKTCDLGGTGAECTAADCCVRYVDGTGGELGYCIFSNGRNRICSDRCNLPGEGCEPLFEECATVPVPGDGGYSAYACVPRTF